MCDPIEPYDVTMSLCTRGMTASGWECTGHAHVGGQHIRCSDAFHAPTQSATWIALPSDGLSLTDLLAHADPVTYPLAGTERWTCSATPDSEATR